LSKTENSEKKIFYFLKDARKGRFLQNFDFLTKSFLDYFKGSTFSAEIGKCLAAVGSLVMKVYFFVIFGFRTIFSAKLYSGKF
jgi:hypothetical protein